MQQKAFTLHNRGMNRDLSISKAGESSAYENHNIRIIARDNDTMLSVTNERGNKEIPLENIEGTLIGWNVLNNHIILFTTTGSTDYIYRVDYDNPGFRITYGGDKGTVNGSPIYSGNLGFDVEHPIESIVYHETEDIQKIYWIDGINPLRFMNFTADVAEVQAWNDGDNTHFDSNRPINFTVSADITKDNSGNNRANGVVQYLLTYFNKHGQETGVAWVSDLVYLSPLNKGGSADGINSNKVTINFKNLDTRFSNYRVYSIFRSALNGTAVAYIVGEGNTGDNSVIVDDGAHLVAEDVSRLLYLGSKNLVAGTMTHKDQTLFLGDLQSTGDDFTALEAAIKNMYDKNGISNAIEFIRSDSNDTSGVINDIPYSDTDGTYSYTSQLIYSSSDILSFKGGEKYRFALSFRTKSGVSTKAFWIGDKVNTLYPIIDVDNNIIKRVVARCSLPQNVINEINAAGLSSVQLMIAEATYADRSVKAQGIVNPTVFNVWERYNSRLYSMPSWISRPRHSGISCTHFSPIENSTTSSGEIQCNYWDTQSDPTPYYRLNSQGELIDDLDGLTSFNYVQIIYRYWHSETKPGSNNDLFRFQVFIVTDSAATHMTNAELATHERDLLIFVGKLKLNDTAIANISPEYKGNAKQISTYVKNFMYENGITDTNSFVQYGTLLNWFQDDSKQTKYRIQGNSSYVNYDLGDAIINHGYWINQVDVQVASADAYTASLYKRHLMFIDENVVTLNSPEFEYESVYLDNKDNDQGGYKFRIVGVAKITGGYADYTVDASHGKASGENLVSTSFIATNESGNIDGISAWPLWKENGLEEKKEDEEELPPVEDRTSKNYVYNSDIVKYWLYMWNHRGKIDSYDDEDGNDYSSLHSKVFANMRFSNCTLYKDLDSISCIYQPESIRMFTALSSQYTGVDIAGSTVYYDGCPNISLSLPGSHKYPILYSQGMQDTNEIISSGSAYLYINDSLPISYMSKPHAVISLNTSVSGNMCSQDILPSITNNDTAGILAGAIVPWYDKLYSVRQSIFSNIYNGTANLGSEDRYLFIGEIYDDFEDNDTRYGGISESAIESCRFIAAGPSYAINDISSGSYLYANQGDTYIQRWDCLKTTPTGASDPNGVIDVTSVMLETHVNIDGRTDNLRGTKYLASIPTQEFGALNPVYSQQNNYFMQRVLDEDTNLDAYRSSITWTLDKHDSADIDEWTHITLANSLKLDGDKGICRALRRFNNSIISFQDRAISEILFNSRTQLTTTDGVPVEIANSGKVDGKRYITNKYGCTNKWSITEGKAALYFVDNINKAFCAFGGQGIQSLSTSLGFDAWFRRANKIDPWTPNDFDNIISFYDRIHSDVYLVTNTSEDDMPCLVYNETIGAFTSFFDYASVPMMANVDDRFISFRNNKLWLQNEGLYCNFFGKQYDYWVNYRVTPDPFGDKIWTNVDYRADYYRVLDSTGKSIVPESLMINGEFYDSMPGTYQDTETFDTLRIWNEYQNTGEITLGNEYSTDKTTRRKFRIWHVAIPRAQKSERNKWGLDRIRNPWINLLFKKKADSSNRDLMQLHDVIVRYFE